MPSCYVQIPGTITASPWEPQNVCEHGARGNGKTDDTLAVQKAIDAVPDGGAVYVPAGVYRMTAPLKIRTGSLRLFGDAMRYPRRDADCVLGPPVILSDHDGACLLIATEKTTDPPLRGLQVDHLALRRSELRACGTGVEWQLKAESRFGCCFDFSHVAISEFGCALAVVGEGNRRHVGNVSIRNSAIMFNGGILRCMPPTRINNLVIHNNQLGQNTSGLDLAGLGIEITSNVLEGAHQKDPIVISRHSRGVRITGNHFERNPGTKWKDDQPTACIRLTQVHEFYCGPNVFVNVETEQPAYVWYCARGTLQDPGEVAHNPKHAQDATDGKPDVRVQHIGKDWGWASKDEDGLRAAAS